MSKLYKTGELAKAVGLSPETVLKYEKQGLIPPAFRDNNDYRRYTERHRAELIRLLTEGKK